MKNNFNTKVQESLSDATVEIHQIFDKVFKKILTLSSRAVINLINGLFETDYSLDSTITYNWTEFEDDSLKRILADTIITIDSRYSYHLEAQIERDNSIVFRVFEYGYSHANRTRLDEEGRAVLRFPRPMVIYLYYEGQVPDEYSLILEFDEGKDTYEYKVPVLKLPEVSSKELSDKKMVILIPFHVLKLRYALKKGDYSSVDELQKHILNDILGNIKENLRLGNITLEDSLKLRRYLIRLCDYLSRHHKELEGMRDMTDESFMTDIDILCKEHEEAIDVLCQEHEEAIQHMSQEHEEAMQHISHEHAIEISTRDEKIVEQDKQIAMLKKQLEELKK